MSGEGGDKTEKATPTRMRQLRRDGALQRSQDMSAWLVVGAAALTLPMVIERADESAQAALGALDDIATAPDPWEALSVLGEALASLFMVMAPLFGVAILAAVLAGAAQGGIHLSTKRLKPSLKHFNPKDGAKRLFGGQAWWNGAKAALKAGVIGVVLYSVVSGSVHAMIGTGFHSVTAVLDLAADGAVTLVRAAIVAGLALAAADMLVVMRRNRKQTRMSKKEIRDEHKQQEGDPHIKGQIRSRQLAMSRNRMMAAVAGADVVMVNPTHVAVALRYEPGTGAPRVVAKGRGHIAARIRAVAAENQVPMVQDVPLARALHDACELGQEIPPYLYAAVARVLAFVMALRRRGSVTGILHDPQAEAVLA